jgi:WD40 repeat protein
LAIKTSKYLRILKNLILILFIFIVVIRCQENSENDSQNLTSRLEFELLWAGLGDSNGGLESPFDSAVVEAAEFSKDEKYLVTGSALGKEVIVWDNKTHEKVFEKHFDNKLEIVTFSPDNQYLLAGGEFNFLYIWNTEDWSLYKKVPLPSGIEGMSYSDNGKLLALGREDGMVFLVDTRKFTIKDSILHGYFGSKPKYNTPGYRADVNSLDFSPDGEYLVTGGLDGEIKIWHLNGLQLIKTIKAHNASIKSVRINKSGNCIASASTGEPYTGDNTIKIWDFKSGNMLHQLSSPLGMEAVEFTPCGNFLVGGAREFQKNIPVKEKPVGFIYVYYIPDDFLSNPIRLIHKEPVAQSDYFYFNGDGSKMVSGHDDGFVRVWNVIYK